MQAGFFYLPEKLTCVVPCQMLVSCHFLGLFQKFKLVLLIIDIS